MAGEFACHFLILTMFKKELTIFVFKIEHEGSDNMTRDYWDEIKQLENTYDICRKKIMNCYQLTAIEVDVLMFLARNPRYDTAAMISSVRKIPKSHVSLAVKLLSEKSFLQKEEDKSNKKKIHLIITEQAKEIIQYGIMQQEIFSKELLKGFTQSEIALMDEFVKRIANNLREYEKNA